MIRNNHPTIPLVHTLYPTWFVLSVITFQFWVLLSSQKLRAEVWPSVKNTGLSCDNLASTLDLQEFDRLYQSIPPIYTMKLVTLANIHKGH